MATREQTECRAPEVRGLPAQPGDGRCARGGWGLEAAMTTPGELARVAAIGDIHCNKGSGGAFQPLLARVAERADVLVICGDLTDHGLPEEAQVLAREIGSSVRVPIVAVLGNHDYESG